MITFKEQKIVVPFDFSNRSRNVFNQVRQWADESNEIHLIHVVIPTPTVMDVNPPVWMPENLDFESKQHLLEKMTKEYSYTNVKHHCVIGNPGNEIVKLANEERADVIVMPSHGRSGLSRFFLGSVAERVLRMSECPVFILRGAKYEDDDAGAKTEPAAVEG